MWRCASEKRERSSVRVSKVVATRLYARSLGEDVEEEGSLGENDDASAAENDKSPSPSVKTAGMSPLKGVGELILGEL